MLTHPVVAKPLDLPSLCLWQKDGEIKQTASTLYLAQQKRGSESEAKPG